MTTRPIGRVVDSLSISNFGTQMWAYDSQTKDRGALQLAEMQDSMAVQTRPIRLADGENFKSICVTDNHLVRVRSGKLEIADFKSGTTIHSVPCPMLDRFRLEHIQDTKSFLMSETYPLGSSIGAEKQQFLFEVSEGKPRQIANWNEIAHYPFRIAHQSYILSLLADGVTIEVRNATSGDVVSRYSIPQSRLMPKTMLTIDSLSYGKSWIQWRSDPFLYTDALTGKTLPVAHGSMLLERDLDSNRLITLDTNAGGSIRKRCIVVDATTGEESNRFEIAIGRVPFFNDYGGCVMIDKNQIVFPTQDCRFLTYEISSGNLIRVFDPLLWADWCNRLSSLAFGFWCIAWLYVCAKMHRYGWIDFAICSGVSVAFCCYQLRYNTEPKDSFFMLCGNFGSWILAAATWLVFGNLRLSLRIQPLILFIGITTGIVALTTTKDQGLLAPFVVGLSMVVVEFLVALLTLRFLRFRFQNELAVEKAQEKTRQHRSSAVALRDVFSLTMVFALFFAVVRWLPAANWSQARLVLEISIFTIAIAIPCLLAFYTALGRDSWKARWGIWAAIIIVSEILCMALSKQNVPWMTILTAVVPTLFCFYAYRLRGWRLGR